ncbi:PP2C family serine/threonine-protein phosphatase [Sneathiella sp. HT1-7]|uniref:PP2C family serine/threonine-protein phosphatase n=1 Tax=Sneathiella sp. HT1-7 TaxID=2887192 RepID=UPI001D13E4EA|nr:PP2C family serine/threonine-protein phosphatase [Sneathiella sp. HT1-7]MCC3306026.1 protein phosphatase 2C domain-containing protein [Sneathiella sp. HT1-7]
MSFDCPDWKIAGASVRGAAHSRSGRPNQDAVMFLPDTGIGTRIVAAVSDGHGSAPYFRSSTGARLATQGAADILAWHLDTPDEDEIEGALVGEIISHWQTSVIADLDTNPISEEEGHYPSRSAFTPYGTTLITAAANENIAILLQIGDGDLLLGYADGNIERPLRDDVGLQGEETYSLCQDDAGQYFRIATMWNQGDQRWPDFLLLATDGVAKSFRDNSGFEEAIKHLRTLAHNNWEETIEALPAWLEEVSSNGSGDDSTICIAIRTDTDMPRKDKE